MIRGSREYNANMSRIRQLREIISRHNQDLKYTSRAWGSLSSFAGKLGINGRDDLVGFTRAADQTVVALSQDLGGNVEETVRQLGKLVDIFKLEDELEIKQAMHKVGSALNGLGAASTAVVEGTPVSDFLPVMLLDNREGTVGMFEFVWEDAISENPATFDVQIELNNCHYTGMSMKYPLTVYNAAGDFITSGGNLWITEAADGFYAPSPGSKMNFGFNVKFNKKGTNLQGKMNIIYRVLNEKGEILKIYQIKSNAMTSLGTNLKNRDALVAEFVSKANLMDVTDVDEFGNGAEIMGNLTLYATMTDQGEPGNMDMIGFSLFNGDPATNPGSLVMSSNWSGTKTAEQVIGGGNLVVHSGAALSTDPQAVDPVSPPKKKSAELSAGLNSNIEVYPNPFNERLMFEFMPTAEGDARIDMYDLTGRMVQKVFKQPVEAGVSYNAEFKPRNDVSGIYLYRITMGNEVFNGRIIYRK